MYKINTEEIDSSWFPYLKNEFSKKYFLDIQNFLENESKNWKIIFPKAENIFRAIEKLALNNVKVVIIGQDPYHDENQAHWLAFSVPDRESLPASLKNIFKEMKKETKTGNLEYLEKQWVLLLNSILTVEAHNPASHSNIWWENFTDEIIKIISENNENIVFLLWWNFAKSKAKFIDKNKHLLLETSHPSPLWSYRWFLWSNCFIKTNEFLKSHSKKEIEW